MNRGHAARPHETFSNPLSREVRSSRGYQGRFETREVPSVNLVNNSLTTLNPGDVVIIDTTQDLSVCLTAPGDVIRIPLVVFIGGPHDATVKCYTPGFNIAVVMVDAANVFPGDFIVASGTERLATLDTGVAGEYHLGVALEGKPPGVPGRVQILLTSF